MTLKNSGLHEVVEVARELEARILEKMDRLKKEGL